jgi:hypothetical protein
MSIVFSILLTGSLWSKISPHLQFTDCKPLVFLNADGGVGLRRDRPDLRLKRGE